MGLFVFHEFVSHAGVPLPWKVECDALTDADLDALAAIIASQIEFGSVYGIPRGGERIAAALMRHATHGPLLIVDDVLTTGTSMEEARAALGDPDALGVVLFARRPPPRWVRAVFTVTF